MWLGFGMISGIETLVAELIAGQLAIALPPDFVRTWPVIGARVHERGYYAPMEDFNLDIRRYVLDRIGDAVDAT